MNKGKEFLTLLLGEKAIKAIEKAGMTIDYNKADKLVEVLTTSILSKNDIGSMVEKIVE